MFIFFRSFQIIIISIQIKNAKLINEIWHHITLKLEIKLQISGFEPTTSAISTPS